MAEVCMFPLPKQHWLPHKGVKECMSCSSTFVKTLFHSSKDNCRKCGRVVCKQCLKYKIKDVRNICAECYKSKDNENRNKNKNISPLSIEKTNIYAQYEDMKNNPYLSEDSLKQYQRQFNLPMAMHKPSLLSDTSVPVPQSLLDFTTDIPLPGSKAPSLHIISPLLKEDEDDQRFKYQNPNKKRASFTREFRERKLSDHQRKSSQSVGSIGLSNASHKSPKCVNVKRKSITVIKWIADEIFDIDEKCMKLVEEACYSQAKINNTQAMIIRLDGYSFGIFTAKMKKPFDKRFHSAMVYTACDLLREFDAYTVFVQSDEILLIYPSSHHQSKANYLFAGKIAKILSIVSSFASMRFIRHLQREYLHLVDKDENVQNCFASFNGKCFNVPDENEIFNYIIWRLKKNVRGYHKKILTVDNEFCHGTFVKKEKYFNVKKKKERERITSCCVEIESKNEKYYQLLSDKYWKNTFLQEMQNKSNNMANDAVHKGDTLSFDDDDVFPDLYNTMIVHEGNTMKRIAKPVANNVDEKKYNLVPKRQSLPIKRTRDIQSIAARFDAEKKEKPQSQTPKRVILRKKEEIVAKFEPESRKQKISQKQVIVPKKKEKKETIIAEFEAELKKQQIIEKEREKKRKKVQKEAIEIKNDIYDENNIYSTMIIHDINNNQKTAKIIKVIKPNQKKSFFKPKKKAYHHHNNNDTATPKNAQKQKLKVPKVMISNASNGSNTNGKINKLNDTSKGQEKKKKKIVKPASSNPNYKYNYNINLNQVQIAKKPQKKDSPKAMSAKDRIREMNQRFQKQ